MDLNSPKLYEVSLLPISTVTAAGNIYPKEVIEKAIQDLKLRRGLGSKLYGECGTPKHRAGEAINRYNARRISIAEENIAISIDTETLEIKNGLLVGKCVPAGPLGSVIEELLENNQAQFAMRAINHYDLNHVQLKDPIVARCDILSFDIVNVTSN